MIIKDILTQEELVNIRYHLESAEWQEGKATAKNYAKKVKKNLQANPASCVDATSISMHALMNNEKFQKLSYVKTVNFPIFSMCTAGMYYGSHTDDPLMRKGNMFMRTDLAMTLFLSEPFEYEGGELSVGGEEYKLPAGSMVLYPADQIHEVKEVTGGCRQVMVNWCHSLIQDHAHRDILVDLEKSRTEHMDLDTWNQVNSIYNRLVRMWADV